MKFTLKIENFGKLQNATIQVNNLTILAGKNNSGKSFVSKGLYSFLSVISLDYIQEKLSQRIDSLFILFETVQENISSLGQEDKKFLIDAFIDAFQNLLSSLKTINMKSDERKAIVDRLIDLCNDYKNHLETENRKFDKIKTSLDQLEDQLHQLKKLLDSPIEVMKEALETVFETSLKQNFQINNLKQLNRIDTIVEPATFIFKEGGETEWGKIKLVNERVSLSIQLNRLEKIQTLSRAIYIESPIYWKLKSALEWIDHSLQRLKLQRQQHLTGIPQHFYDLVNLLRLQPTEPPKFSEILKEIETEMGGRLKLSPEGSLVFQEKKAIHPISVTALGIANLGMLALLLEKNLIDSGTFLFIDEPEAHLHPAWQVIFIKALYQLAEADVNVIIATHSVDIIKYIEVLAKKDKQAQSRIALNHLSVEGFSCQEETGFYETIKQIKQELTEPFYDLYLEGL